MAAAAAWHAAARPSLRGASLLLLLLGGVVPRAWASYGFTQTYAVLNVNATGNQYLAGGYNPAGAPVFGTQSLGPFGSSSSLLLGGQVQSYENGTDNVSGAKLYYKIYLTSNAATAPGFSPLTLPLSETVANSPDTDRTWTNIDNKQNQSVNTAVDLLKSLKASGNYTVEVYWTVSLASGSTQSDPSSSSTSYKVSFDYTTAPLPVTLTTFGAQQQGAAAVLSWTTASEHDNAGYEVQVGTSASAADFRTLAFVAAPTADSQVPRSYSYRDQEPGLLGLRYYRLRQLDLSGEATYSAVCVVQFGVPGTVSLTAAPNPFGSSLLLTVELPQAAPSATLTLADALGRPLLRQDLGPLPAGASQPALSAEVLSQLRPGLYVLRLALPGRTQVLRLAKQ